MLNKKYTSTKKNGGIIPNMPVIGYEEIKKSEFVDEYTDEIIQTSKGGKYPIYDTRVKYIYVPCGECMECRKQKANEWRVRILEEIKEHKYNYFITFTFAPERLDKLLYRKGLKEDNEVCAYALRHSLERYRKDYKKSIKHWGIVELGHENTERIHIHAILFSDNELEFKPSEDKRYHYWKYWRYGLVFVGDYVNARTANYIVKYLQKIDTDHKTFKGRILCSPGIGKTFINKEIAQSYNYLENPKLYYIQENGQKTALPKYYKNKLYTETERELMWREYMDEEKITILGTEYEQKDKELENVIIKSKEINKKLDYGDNTDEWKKKKHYITKEMLESKRQQKKIREIEARIEIKKKLLKMTKKIQKNLLE